MPRLGISAPPEARKESRTGAVDGFGKALQNDPVNRQRADRYQSRRVDWRDREVAKSQGCLDRLGRGQERSAELPPTVEVQPAQVGVHWPPGGIGEVSRDHAARPAAVES